jgi:hypothetical protein
MSQIVHEFTIKRKGMELELQASFEITKTRNGGHAVLDGEIFLADGIPWDGRLTRNEKDKIEHDAWENYAESEASAVEDESCILDEAYDDQFDIDMAIKSVGQGAVSW